MIGAYAPSLVNFRGPLIREIVARRHDVIGMANETAPDVAAALCDLGAGYRPYPVRRGSMNPIAELRTLLSLGRTLREVRPDIVLAYTAKPVIWTGLALRAFPRVRFIAMIEGLGYAFYGENWYRRVIQKVAGWLYRGSLSRAACVIFLNSDNRAEFVRRRIMMSERSALVDGAGVDTEVFAPTPFPKGPTVFLTIARLLADKGLREYAEAARRVRARYPEAVFRLVGPEDESPDRIRIVEVQRWQDEGALEYGGAATDVRPHIAGCHVYVLPSYHEGMPRTVLEAMAMGRPILTTDAPGCRETVVPGDNGFLVPVRDVDALVARMIWFIEHRSEIGRMGARGRDIAVERFDVGRINNRMMQIIGLTA